MFYKLSLAITLITVSASYSCKDQPDSEQKETNNGEPVAQTGTIAISSTEIETEVTTAGTNLSTVSETMVPSSMEPGTVAVSTALNLQDSGPAFCQNNPTHQMCQDCSPNGSKNNSLECKDFFGPNGEGYTEGDQQGGGGGNGDGEGPCKGLGFFDCQPVLVKLYLKISRDMVERLAKHVKQSAGLLKVADKVRGEIIPKEGQWERIEYRITSATDMEFLFSDKSGKALHLTIAEKKYSLEARHDSSGDGPSGFHSVTVDYLDEDSWTAEIRVKQECDENDPQAPGTIGIRMEKTIGLWQGKAMLFSPRWPQGGCSDPFTKEGSIAIYTDFVGESQFTTASLLMIPTDVKTLTDNATSYNIENLCTNFPAFCNGATAFEEALPKNPFCSKPNGTHDWDTKCAESAVAEVANGVYSASSEWIPPEELGAMTLSVGDLAK